MTTPLRSICLNAQQQVHSRNLLELSLRKSYNDVLEIIHLYAALVAEKARERAK
jgi:hypothetical protein